jgi:hypothetical protein
MTNGFEIVSSGLFITDVSVDTSITCGTCKVLPFSEGDVLSIRVFIALSQTKINNENVVLVIFISTDKEVVRFDISMNYSFFVNFLNTLNLLKRLFSI